MISRRTITILVISCLLGCASIDSSLVRARPGAPESARVDRLEIPYDDSLPKYALIVEAFVKEGPVSETKIRSHQFFEQHDKRNGSSQSNASLTGSSQERIRDRQTTQIDSQNKALVLDSPSEEANTKTRHPMLKNVSTSDSPEAVLAARSKGSATIHNDRKYGSETSGELTGRGTTKSHGHQHLTQHNDGAVDVTHRSWEVSRSDINIAAQFTSSLAGVGNFLLLSPAAAKSTGDGLYRANVPSGAVGPFIIKAIVTEEVHEVEGNRTRVFVPGVVSSKKSELKGVVVLDITVLDGRTGALVTAFPTEGTFISQDKRFSAGVILPLAEQHAFARSVVSQAQRVALNEAAARILEAFRNYRS
jgi:hypothetical protein